MFERPINNGWSIQELCPSAGRIAGVLMLQLLVLSASGCQEKEPPPVAYIGPTLTVADLGATPAECPPTGFIVLEQQSKGRFPGALAVAFLTQCSPGSGASSWCLGSLKEEDATWWNQLLNTAPALREVLVMDRSSIVSPDDGQDAIVAGARRLKADLCLLYGPAPAPTEHTAYAGVIRETEAGRIVALVRAQAGPPDYTDQRVDTVKEDQKHIDPTYIAARRFEQQVRRCVLQLTAQDVPVAATQPSPWSQHGKDKPAPMYILPDRRIDY